MRQQLEENGVVNNSLRQERLKGLDLERHKGKGERRKKRTLFRSHVAHLVDKESTSENEYGSTYEYAAASRPSAAGSIMSLVLPGLRGPSGSFLPLL